MEEKQKTTGEKRREALLYQQKNGYDCLSPADESGLFGLLHIDITQLAILQKKLF